MFDVLPEEQRKVLEIWKQPEHKINFISDKMDRHSKKTK